VEQLSNSRTEKEVWH